MLSDTYIAYRSYEIMAKGFFSIFLKSKFPVLASILFVSMCTSANFTKVAFGNTEVSVEIADSSAELEKGLMNRASLGEKNGMLFVFPDEEKRSFWMKNTLLPLDIIFLSSDFTVVDIKKNFQPCKSIICETYASKADAMYVLEVNANFTSRNTIKIGDKAVVS